MIENKAWGMEMNKDTNLRREKHFGKKKINITQ